MIIRNKDGFRWGKGNSTLMFIRAFAGTIGILGNFYAVDHLMLSDATMLNKMSPFFAIIFSIFLMKEKVSLSQALYSLRMRNHQYITNLKEGLHQ